MLRSIALAVLVLALSGSSQMANGQVQVRGHYRSNGTYVAPHYRSYPDGSSKNNWSTYPNVNPYTGVTGTRHYPAGNAWDTKSGGSRSSGWGYAGGAGALGVLGYAFRRRFLKSFE